MIQWTVDFTWPTYSPTIFLVVWSLALLILPFWELSKVTWHKCIEGQNAEKQEFKVRRNHVFTSLRNATKVKFDNDRGITRRRTGQYQDVPGQRLTHHLLIIRHHPRVQQLVIPGE